MDQTLIQFVKQVLDPTAPSALPVSLQLFRPELAICATIVLMLLVRVCFRPRGTDSFLIALGGSLIGLYYALPWKFEAGLLGGGERAEIFSQLLVYDRFTLYFRCFFLLFAVLLVLLCKLTGIPDDEDAPDFYTLTLGATLGMCLMASANNLLMVFMAVEMASVPSYALSGLLKGRRQSSEAALKYAVYGAGAAGVMLYGISLLAGVLGSCHLPTMADQLALLIQTDGAKDSHMVLVLGGLMLMVGLAFKLSAVPFHFWAPDVYTGASAEVNAFLSVASKAAAFALLIRVVVGLGYGAPAAVPVPTKNAALVDQGFVAVSTKAEPVATPADHSTAKQLAVPADKPLSLTNEQRVAALAGPRLFMVWVLAIMAMVTCTFGNLAAYSQTNIKRMLAYSSIAHAGYMLMGVAAGVALIGVNQQYAGEAFSSIAFYLATYLFMNLAAFAIIALLRNSLHSEEYAAYAGMIRTNPGLSVCLILCLISLIGLPPAAGFIGKLQIFYSVTQAVTAGPVALKTLLLIVLFVGAINTAISLYYYLRVVKIMTIDPPSSTRPTPEVSLLSFSGIYVVAVSLPVMVLGLFFNGLLELTRQIAGSLLS